MRVLIGIILLFILPGAVWTFWDGVSAIAFSAETWKPMAAGFAAGLLLCRRLSRFLLLKVFGHEAAHALMSMLFLRRITRFVVTRQGGYIEYTGGAGGALGDHMIGLAPYFFPTIVLCVVLARPVFQPPWLIFCYVLTGLAFACHFWSVADNILHAWHKESFYLTGTGIPALSDIGKRGYIFSSLMIVTMNFLFCGLVLFLLTEGYFGTILFASSVLIKSVGFYWPIFVIIPTR